MVYARARLPEKVIKKITIKKTAKTFNKDEPLEPKFGGLIFNLDSSFSLGCVGDACVKVACVKVGP